MKLPSWFRATLRAVADEVRDVRLSGDGQTLHVLASNTSLADDDGNMWTTWQLRSVDLRSGWVDVADFERAPDDRDAHAKAVQDFWRWAKAETSDAALQELPPAPVPWQLHDPRQSDTQRATQAPLRDGLKIDRHGAGSDRGRVHVLRDGQVLRSHGFSGATHFPGRGARLWVGGSPAGDQALVIAGAKGASVLVLDPRTGRRLLHAQI